MTATTGLRAAAMGVLALTFALAPIASEAQVLGQGPQSFQSGCSGTGPGIITGHVPNFTQDTVGMARIVASGAGGDAYISEVRSEEASREWMSQMAANPKALSAYVKNPTLNPAALGGFKGDVRDSQALLAYFASEQQSLKLALAAAQSASTVMLAKDGSFECHGLPSGKYHVVVTVSHGSMQAAMGGMGASGLSQTTLEADLTIPRVKNGQRVLVQVSQYSVLSSLKK